MTFYSLFSVKKNMVEDYPEKTRAGDPYTLSRACTTTADHGNRTRVAAQCPLRYLDIIYGSN